MSATEDRQLKNEGNVSSLLAAASEGNLENLLDMLKGNLNINASNTNSLNVLHQASKKGHVHIVEEMSARNASVKATTKKGNTALHIASLAGHNEVVHKLVKDGADVNVRNRDGFTPLYMAAHENHVEIVRFLLEHGAQQDIALEDGFTPLDVAVQQGHERVVALLLASDGKSRSKRHALHIAAKKDYKEAAALLLAKESPDTTSPDGFTPLHIAAHYGNTDVALVLIQHGATLNYRAKNETTPLHVSARWGRLEMLKLLLDQGAGINDTTKDGLTPLHCAARSGHVKVMDVLLERGADLSSKTRSGLTPLHMAAQGGNVDCARLLLNWKAPVDDVTEDGFTPLFVAANYNRVEVVRFLLERGAQPNVASKDGITPLAAQRKGHDKVVALLLESDCKSRSRRPALHIASKTGDKEAAGLLLTKESPDTASRAEGIDVSKASNNVDDVVELCPTASSKLREPFQSSGQSVTVEEPDRTQQTETFRVSSEDAAEGPSGDHMTSAVDVTSAPVGQESRPLPESADEWLHRDSGRLPEILTMKNIKEVKLKIDERKAYDMDIGGSGVKGRVICIHYEDVLGENYREGNDRDVEALKEVFGCELLRFDFVEITDKQAATRDELLAELRSQAQRDDLENIRVLFVFVMSHGSRDVFLTALSDEVTIDDLMSEFDAINCPALKDRPKSFFIQACQGDRVQVDSRGEPTEQQMQQAHRDAQTHKADMMKYVCTYPGSLAGRLSNYGTFYIQAICYVFASYSHADNVSDMMSMAAQVVNTHKYRYRTVPYVFGNQKILYLCPGH